MQHAGEHSSLEGTVASSFVIYYLKNNNNQNPRVDFCSHASHFASTSCIFWLQDQSVGCVDAFLRGEKGQVL